jgi:hydroxymethylpyrimidine pyrophosphatase-like HAD family hydrolase
VLPAGVNKGTALAWIAEKEDIAQADVMAIGDSMNDDAMVRWAGYGVAMANGSDELKKIARIVSSKTNDEDGVAEVIEKYVLK